MKKITTSGLCIMLLSISFVAFGQSRKKRVHKGAIVGSVLGNAEISQSNSALGAILQAGVGGNTGRIISREMDELSKQIQEAIPGAKVERIEEGIKIILSEKILAFQAAKKDIPKEANLFLDKFAEILTKEKRTYLTIYGYTDSEGREEFNAKISRNRATAIKMYLSTKKVSSKRIGATGVGVADPIDSNATEQGRANNRRIEMAIVANEDMIVDAQRQASREY